MLLGVPSVRKVPPGAFVYSLKMCIRDSCVENKLFDTSVVEVLQRTEEDGYRTVLYNDFR